MSHYHEYETDLAVYFDGVHYTIAESATAHRRFRPTEPDEHGFDDRVRKVHPGRWVACWCEPGTTTPAAQEEGCLVKMRAFHWVLANGRGYLCTEGL